jgi:hypothetical protein
MVNAMPAIALPEGVSFKVRRAEQLVRELDAVVTAYTDNAPVELVPGRHPDHTSPNPAEAVWGVLARVNTAPPGQISAIIGDIAHNLSSSLAYLARGLVVSNGGTPVDSGGRNTDFPVLQRDIPENFTVPGGVDNSALEALKELQPGRGGLARRHPLALLRELSNEDKHRSPAIAVTGLAFPAAFRIVDDHADEPYGMVSPLLRPLRDQEWAVKPMFPFSLDAHVTVEGIVRASVAFPGNDVMRVPVVHEMDYLLRYVRGVVIPKFRPYFSHPWPDLFAPQDVEDPLVGMLGAAINEDQVLDDTRALVGSFPTPPGETHPRLLVMGLAKGLNVDPRLLAN